MNVKGLWLAWEGGLDFGGIFGLDVGGCVGFWIFVFDVDDNLLTLDEKVEGILWRDRVLLYGWFL